MRKKQAFLISFEGIEGTGKSTHCRLLGRFLKNKGFKVVILREPGSSGIGEKIRQILLHTKGRITNLCEAMLFSAARVQLVDEKIKPNLSRQDVIILDRYIDATVAYQGYGAGLDIRLIKQLNQIAISGLMPQLTLLLDIAPNIGIKRSGRSDRFEKRKITFHRRVRNGYLKIARANKKRIRLVSTKADIQQIQKNIQKIVCDELRIAEKK